MKNIKVIIVDDERLAREELKRHLQSYEDFSLLGEAENADEAESMIVGLKPDLLLLDIQMPGINGFELLENLEELPEIIFTTAFDTYAVKAFEINALDYLVKPVREERFQKAIEKVREKLVPSNRREKTIFVKEGEQYFFVQMSDVYLIESIGNYARLYFKNKKVHIKRSLNQLEKSLDENQFFRINRTEIINTNYIKQIQRNADTRLLVTLHSGEQLTVSNRQSALLKSKNML